MVDTDSTGRKLDISDFPVDDNETIPTPSYHHHQRRNDKINGYRKQTEYGLKKYIKPWRTGAKSQQIPTKGNGKQNGGKK